MRARLPMMIQDPEISQTDVGRMVEDWIGLDQEHYLDGPVTPRIALVDLDPDTEALRPAVKFQPPAGSRTLGRYAANRNAVESRAFIAVSAFATVWRTVKLFEEERTLGRTISWGFDAPQLLVVPQAGWLENAYYERSSHSLQFFAFDAGNKTIYTSLSRDIVAHETAHALIDGIDPDLYDALEPQALALHEGIADLTAMLIAFDSGRLTHAILDKTQGRIDVSNAFSSIGEQFGDAIARGPKPGFLRNLHNDAKIDPRHEEIEPHALSQVISGVLYELIVDMHEHFKDVYAPRFGGDRLKASGLALAVAAKLFQRMVLRGIDYLPPGEVTFADFGRAILAADEASPGDRQWGAKLRARFVERRIVADEATLDVRTNFESPPVGAVNLQGLTDSEWVAYRFADGNRDLLGIPADAEFEVLKRVVVDGRVQAPEQTAAQMSKRAQPPAAGEPADGAAAAGDTTPDPDSGTPFRELLFKVRWSQVEDNPPGFDPPQRRVQTGTTLVIDWNGRQVRALQRPINFEERRSARDAVLSDLVDRGIVEICGPEGPAHGAPSPAGIDAVATGGILRVKQTARLLHVVQELDA
ncbi:MAG TPA: hypothetical protein VID95_13840 [Candidatus Limnocylindrales bacterium]|jgi:hypothetical protein